MVVEFREVMDLGERQASTVKEATKLMEQAWSSERFIPWVAFGRSSRPGAPLMLAAFTLGNLAASGVERFGDFVGFPGLEKMVAGGMAAFRLAIALDMGPFVSQGIVSLLQEHDVEERSGNRKKGFFDTKFGRTLADFGWKVASILPSLLLSLREPARKLVWEDRVLKQWMINPVAERPDDADLVDLRDTQEFYALARVYKVRKGLRSLTTSVVLGFCSRAFVGLDIKPYLDLAFSVIDRRPK